MKLYLIRHGESETNKAAIWTGWMDVQLTEQGEEDARLAGRLLEGIVFDKVYSSDLTRAQKTAQLALPGCHYTCNPLLREVDLGTLAGQPLQALAGEAQQDCSENGYARFGGETRAQFHGRIQAFLSQMEQETADTVAAFSHGGWLRGALDEVFEMRLPRKALQCNNCTVAILEFKNGRWSLHSWINP